MNSHLDTVAFPLGRRARQWFAEQQFDAAREALESLLRQVPANPFVQMDLAAVLLRCGRLGDAATLMLDVAQSDDPQPSLDIQLARGLSAAGEVVATRSCLDRLERAADLPAMLLAEQAHLRWGMRDIPAARRMIDRAVAAGADAPRELHLQAMLRQFAGETDEAGRLLDACLDRWPAFGDAALARANLRTQTAQTHHLDFLRLQLQRLPADAGAPAQLANRAAFEAAVFKELDDLGRYDEAWPAMQRCNALMHRVRPYDAQGETAVVDVLIRVAGSLGRSAAPGAQQEEGPQPIFIVGMPRSGTTLLDRMLSSHSQVASAGEIMDFPQQLRRVAGVVPHGAAGTLAAIERGAELDLADLGARYLVQTRWRAPGCRYFIDKLPTNIRMVAHIRRALPHARIVHVVRDPLEVCFSNLSMMFGNRAAYSYDQRAMVHYYGQYRRLARHWQTTMPDSMIEVAYADLVREPGVALRKVLDHCGLAMEEACLHPERNAAPVATPSAAQVREPIHGRGSGRWRPYASHLDVLRGAVLDMA